MTDTQSSTQEQSLPAYIAFRTVTDLVDRMAVEEPPARIDKSYLDSFSGGYQTQVITALNTLGLRGPAGEVTQLLADLVLADEPGRRAVVGTMVREKYQDVLVLGPNATQQQMIDAFKGMGVNGGDTMRKVVAFFMNAAKFAGIPVSRHWRVPAVPSSSRKRNAGAGTDSSATDPGRDLGADSSGADGNKPPANIRTVELRSGGSVTLAISVDLFDLSGADQEFVLKLIKEIRTYQDQRALPPAAEQPADESGAPDDSEVEMEVPG